MEMKELIILSGDKYMFKVINKDTIETCQILLK